MTPPNLSLPTVIGHRGAAGLAPENTLAALRAAVAAGLRWVELDVTLTADGVPVLMHDERLERTTDGEGRLADTNFADLAQLDAGSWFAPRFLGQRVPTLAEAIHELQQLGLCANLEIKPAPGHGAATATAIVETLRAYWPAHCPAPLLSSFDHAALAAARALGADLLLGFLAERLGDGWHDRVKTLGCVSVHLAAEGLASDELEAVRAAGLPLMLYTVNDLAEAHRLREAGAAGFFTDRPDRVALA
jgi:glycerophosphoryl diester phosphodiesterase